MITKEKVQDAVTELRDAQMHVRQAQGTLCNILFDSLEMPLGEALRLGIVKINFPAPAGFHRALSRELERS